MSAYQYDETSGYYYDPVTTLYYDANSKVCSSLPEVLFSFGVMSDCVIKSTMGLRQGMTRGQSDQALLCA